MSTVKALSIKQPWADAILAGLKPIENRVWPTSFRGQLAIHSGLAPAKPLHTFGGPAGELDYVTLYERQFALASACAGPRIVGGVVGTVRLSDCHSAEQCTRGDGVLCSPWALPNPGPYAKRADAVMWHWVLADPVSFGPDAVMVSGQLGMFDVDLPD